MAGYDIVSRAEISIIGREGSTDDGEGFIPRLWADANARFGEIESMVKRCEGGIPCGFWGAMSDMTRAYAPWEDGFSRGLYLAGAEVNEDAQPPAGWVKWTLPARNWLMIPVSGDVGNTFRLGLDHIAQSGLQLAGAACDFTNPAENGRAYTLFPVEKA